MSAAAFNEVFLAKNGHDGLVGINLHAKMKRYSLACLYGAMLAGVDAVMMGAGVPIEEAEQIPVPASGQTARLRIDVDTGQSSHAVDTVYYDLGPSDLLAKPPLLS